MNLNLMIINDGLAPKTTDLWNITAIKTDKGLRGSNISSGSFWLGTHMLYLHSSALAPAEIKKTLRWSKNLNVTH